MRFSVSRKELDSALATVTRAVFGRSTLPIVSEGISP